VCGVDGEFCDIGGKGRQLDGRPTCACAEGKKSEVAWVKVSDVFKSTCAQAI
jgi:hypothetical protein